MIVESWLNARSGDATRGRVLSAYMAVNLCALALGQVLLLAAPSKSFELFVLVSILISLATVPIVLSRAPAPALAQVPRLPMRRLISISPLGTMGCLSAGIATGAWWSLTPVVIYSIENLEVHVALFMIATILGGLAAQWPIGRLSDHFDRRTVLLTVAFSAAVSSVWIAAFVDRSFALSVAGGIFQGATLFSVYALSVAHANDRQQDHGIVALSAGLLLIYGLGAISGSVAAGAAVQVLGPRGLFAFCGAVFLILTGFGIRRMAVSAPIPLEEQEHFVAASPRATPIAAELDPRAEPDLEDRAA
jgi:MFS family permease